MQSLGEFELARIVELEGPAYAPDFIFPDATDDVFAEHAAWLEPRYFDRASGRVVMCMQAFVIRTARHTIVIDTCIGNDKTRPARPAWHLRNGPFLDDLATAGVGPEDVDFILCTHLHADHVGWNTRLVDGRWVPTFPNARDIFARREYAFWEARHRAAPDDGTAVAFADSVLPVMEANQAVLVEADHQIEDGVWFEPAPGHTEGNVVINVRSGRDRWVFTGDVMHHPVQLVRPDWSSAFCEDPAQSHATRRALIEAYADSDTRIVPAHFPSPTLGRIVREGRAFGWRD